MHDFHDPKQWREYLADFSERNKLRPARLERFADGTVAEEEQLALLESVTIKTRGPAAPCLVVTRRDQTTPNKHLFSDEIPHVRSIGPQLDQDGSEFGLRIEDENDVTTILRMQSTLDGDS